MPPPTVPSRSSWNETEIKRDTPHLFRPPCLIMLCGQASALEELGGESTCWSEGSLQRGRDSDSNKVSAEF